MAATPAHEGARPCASSPSRLTTAGCGDERAPRTPSGSFEDSASSTSSGFAMGGMVGSGANDDCTYPAGPYGVEVGDTLPPDLSWQGIAAGDETFTTIRGEIFLDCDGSRGIHAVLIDSSQYG